MNRIGIIGAVKVKMAELSPFQDEGIIYSETDSASLKYTKPIESYIDSILDEAANECLLDVPIIYCNQSDVYSLGEADAHVIPPVITVLDNVGYIEVPDDFLRIGVIKFTPWERPVTSLITQEDEEYKLQANKYTRSSYSKPVVAIITSHGHEDFQLFSVKEADKALIDSFTYVKMEVVGNDTFPEFLISLLSYLAAAKVFIILENINGAKAAMEYYKKILTSYSM